jgi:hypothetical protein
MASAVPAVAPPRAAFNDVGRGNAPPPSFPSHEIPDVLAGWRAGLAGAADDTGASSAWRWGWQCGASEGRAVH